MTVPEPIASYYSHEMRVDSPSDEELQAHHGLIVGIDIYENRVEAIYARMLTDVRVVRGVGEDDPVDDRLMVFRKTAVLNGELQGRLRAEFEDLHGVRCVYPEKDTRMRLMSLEYDFYLECNDPATVQLWDEIERQTGISQAAPADADFSEVVKDGSTDSYALDHAWKWVGEFECQASLDNRFVGGNRLLNDVVAQLEGVNADYMQPDRAWLAFLAASLTGIEWGLNVGVDFDKPGVYFSASDYEDFDRVWSVAVAFIPGLSEAKWFRSVIEVYAYFHEASRWMEMRGVSPPAGSSWYGIVETMLKEFRLLVCKDQSMSQKNLGIYVPIEFIEKKDALDAELARLAEETRTAERERFIEDGPGPDAPSGTHPAMLDGFKPLSFIWFYDHVEGCAPDEACWTEVTEKLRLATNDDAPEALIGDYPPEQKSERLWEQVLWADQHGVLMKLNDWLFVCDEFDMERKKWQTGCAFHEVAIELWRSSMK
jgi:hypothetical protein